MCRHLVRLVVLLFAALASAHAATIHVPADQPTIQAAINAAANGDTILVAPGIYKENINFNGKAITVTSSGGTSVTTIDGGNKPGLATVVFANAETSTSVISNFTIRGGGNTIFTGTSDGGIYVNGAAPTIQNNTITANYCHNIDVQFGTATIINNEISGVLQDYTGTGTNESYCTFGSAIHLGGTPGEAPTLNGLGNIVIGNTIENNLTGSAVNLWAAQNVLIMNNTIRNNTSPDAGSAVTSANSIGTVVVQNLIYDNTSTCGGALGFEDGGTSASNPSVLIANNTLVDNITPTLTSGSNCTHIAQIYPGPYSYGESGPGVVYLNNIFSGSTSYPAVNCYWYDTPSESIQPTFQNNILHNAGGPFFGSYCVDVSTKYSNITADPQFVNPSAGDYHLKNASPAIDTGQNNSLELFTMMTSLDLSKDFDGKLRVQDATGKGCIIDMGAYEYPNTSSECGTAETLTSSLNPAIVGQNVTFTAQLSAESGTPTGSVQFLDGTTPLSTQTVSTSGAAVFSTNSLIIGSHTITANYQPTGSFSAATASLVQVINGYTTATTITSSLNPSTVGQSVTFTATVTSSNNTPSGTVQFLDGNTAMGTVTLANSSASWTTSALTAGQHTITAVYRASGSDLASTALLTQTVNGLQTTTTLTAAPNPAYALQAVTLTAHVTPATSGTPTGTVTFYDNGAAIGTSALPASGIATLQTSFAAASATPHQLIAIYSGDSTFNTSTSLPFAETIQFNPTTTVIASISPNPVGAFLNTTLTAKVSSTTSPISSATGSVSFSTGGGKPFGTATLTNGTATLQINAGAAGTYPVYASYSGDTAFFPSGSAASTLTVTPEPSTVTLTSSKNPSVFGDSVTFTATATAPGYATPVAGLWEFYDGTTQLGGVNGSGTFTTSTLAVGPHPITAVFLGNGSVTSGISPVLNQVVLAYQGDFTLTATPSSASLYTGAAAKFTVTATPQNGFNLPLALACSGLPAYTTCTFTPATIQNGSYSSTLVVQTSAPAKSASAKNLTTGATALATLFGLLLIPRRLRRNWMRGAWFAIALLAALANLSACGGNGTLTGGTPAGTYPITITASTTVVEPQLSHTTPITLTVKSLF